jgi:hypothetical protein
MSKQEPGGRTPRSRRLRGVVALLIAGIFPAVAAAELAVGSVAPGFVLRGSDGHEYTLEALLQGGQSGVVLAWFPKAFTPG